MINHKSVWWRNWHEQGPNRIENILTPDGAFVPYNDLAQKHIIDFWSYISLLDAIPKDWKIFLKSSRMPEQITTAEQAKNRNIAIGQSSVLIEKAVHRDIFNLFRNEIADAPTVEKKLKKYFSADIDTTLIYSLPYKISRSTTLQYFQYKVTHRYFPTNAHLNKIKIKDTNLCELCAEVDTLDHFFIECHETIGLWQRFFDLFTPILNNSQLTNSQILYGILQTDKNALALNWIILIMKHYIYTHKWKKIAVYRLQHSLSI